MEDIGYLGIGISTSGEKALEIYLSLSGCIQKKFKTPEFTDKYERAYNRFYYEIGKSQALSPRIEKAICKSYHDFIYCRNCAHGLNICDNYCPGCGKAIKWASIRCLTRGDEK